MVGGVKQIEEKVEVPGNKVEVTIRKINEGLDVALLELREEEICLKLRVCLEQPGEGIKEMVVEVLTEWEEEDEVIEGDRLCIINTKYVNATVLQHQVTFAQKNIC